MPQPLRLVFMGTPDFAVASLQRLLNASCTVVAVVTAPDRPSGRGLQLTPSPVKKAAEAAHLPVLQPEKLRDAAFLEQLASFNADLFVVVAFRMLPEVVWSMPTIGTFNLHGSLLPQYRGAAPINWAIINGETETGVTTFFIEKEIDTGQMILQDREPILANDTAGTLHDRLMERGADLVLKTVQVIAENEYTRTPQPTVAEPKAAPKLSRETTEINWNQPAQAVYDFVRGLSPYPSAWTTLNGKFFKIYAVSVVGKLPFIAEPAEFIPDIFTPGETYSDNKTRVFVCAADGWLRVDLLQAEGKRRMTADEFLRGNQL